MQLAQDHVFIISRVGRMFPALAAAQFTENALMSLGAAMTAEASPHEQSNRDPEENSGMSAGYTFLRAVSPNRGDSLQGEVGMPKRPDYQFFSYLFRTFKLSFHAQRQSKRAGTQTQGLQQTLVPTLVKEVDPLPLFQPGGNLTGFEPCRNNINGVLRFFVRNFQSDLDFLLNEAFFDYSAAGEAYEDDIAGTDGFSNFGPPSPPRYQFLLVKPRIGAVLQQTII